MATKPHHILMQGKGVSLDNLLDMFRRLTGREPTPAEIEDARKTMADGEARRAEKV